MKRCAIYFINLMIAIVLAAVALWRVRPWEVWVFDAKFITAALLSLVVDLIIVWFWAHRHALAVRATGTDIPARDLMGLVTFSNAANNLTPAATGEIARGWFLNRRFGVPIEAAAAAIVFERVFMFGFMTLSVFAAGGATTNRPVIWIGASGLIAVYIWLLPALLRPLTRKLPKDPAEGAGRIRRALRTVLLGGMSLWSRHDISAGMALWSVGSFTSMGVIFWLAARNTGLVVDPFQVWVLVGGATVVGVLSTLPFGLGAAELSVVGIAGIIGVPPQEAAAAFVIYRLFFTLPMALAGSYAYARLSLDGDEPVGQSS